MKPPKYEEYKPLTEPVTMSDIHANNYSDDFYDMKTFPRGKLILINVRYFTNVELSEREGTDIDADALFNLFKEMEFIVHRCDNPSKVEIENALKVEANDDYTNLSCCVFAMLSHGKEGEEIYGTDEAIKISEIVSKFKIDSLAGKPKFFLFQACRGVEYMDSFDEVDGKPPPAPPLPPLHLPVEADFLYAYSNVPGYYSWRNVCRGSWFIEAVIAVFREYANKMDVMRMLLRVNKVMADRKSCTFAKESSNKRQVGSFVSQMRKDFFLFPIHGPLKQ